MLPHATGGANWEGGAFDPETNVLYVGSFTNPFILALEPPPEPTDITLHLGRRRAAAVAARVAADQAAIGPHHGVST